MVLNSKGKLQEVEVEINMWKIKFIVDTGSSVNVIDKRTCEEIGLPVKNQQHD